MMQCTHKHSEWWLSTILAFAAQSITQDLRKTDKNDSDKNESTTECLHR
jgi:hypothetical protein